MHLGRGLASSTPPISTSTSSFRSFALFLCSDLCKHRLVWSTHSSLSVARARNKSALMIPQTHPVFQALLGTLTTWAFTAIGAALVFVLDVKDVERSQKLHDAMLGFAAGVMLAASYWSLLEPSIEIASESELYGPHGRWAFVPAAVGFALGAGAIVWTEKIMPALGSLTERPEGWSKKDDSVQSAISDSQSRTASRASTSASLRQRKSGKQVANVTDEEADLDEVDAMAKYGVARDSSSFRRILLLVIAITLHNFPEGLAVGVGFGSVGHAQSASFWTAVNLAIGIGLQNLPEGLAVSMPLRREGMPPFQAFMWGQLSGVVEPIGGVIGAVAVMYVRPILPYALSFAAGAMILVVVDDLIPEASQSGNKKLATAGTIVGFIVMMVMDVALG